MSGAPVRPVQGKVTSGFGGRPDPTDPDHSHFHPGIDFSAHTGTPVLSPWDGKVKSVYGGNSSAGGFQLIIEHNNGYTTGYAHLREAPALSPGQKVKQGKIIAYTGGTGTHTTGPHLHFTLRKNGNLVDPWPLFKNALSKAPAKLWPYLAGALLLLILFITIFIILHRRKKLSHAKYNIQ